MICCEIIIFCLSFLKLESLHFTVQIFDGYKKHTKLTKFDNWFFVLGDYDVFKSYKMFDNFTKI